MDRGGRDDPVSPGMGAVIDVAEVEIPGSTGNDDSESGGQFGDHGSDGGANGDVAPPVVMPVESSRPIEIPMTAHPNGMVGMARMAMTAMDAVFFFTMPPAGFGGNGDGQGENGQDRQEEAERGMVAGWMDVHDGPPGVGFRWGILRRLGGFPPHTVKGRSDGENGYR